MAKKELSESETSGNSSSSSDDEPETLQEAASEYEKQRESRIAENRARMESLGLRKIANSLVRPAEKTSERETKLKSKKVSKKGEEDDEYRPDDEDHGAGDNDGDLNSSSEEFEEEIVNGRNSKSRSIKVKNRKSKSGKQISMNKPMDVLDFVDEDEALMQAIALSLKDSEDISVLRNCGSSKGSNTQDGSYNEKGYDHFQENNTRRRKKKSFNNRVQMSEDDVAIHFCQFDEVGKGSITLRDLQRMAVTHDFTWTDKELADMIRCFDGDGDGKLTLDDFRSIIRQCNMLQGPANP